MNMITLVTLVTLCSLSILLWIFYTSKKEENNYDNFLVQNYHNKPKLEKKVVVVIEKYHNIQNLLTLIRNILNQEIKVDSIILVSRDTEILKKIQLIQNTCILNKTGGLTFLFKESSNNTILLYIYPPSFNKFSQPYFLKQCINTNMKVNGIIKLKTDLYKIDVNKVYTT